MIHISKIREKIGDFNMKHENPQLGLLLILFLIPHPREVCLFVYFMFVDYAYPIAITYTPFSWMGKLKIQLVTLKVEDSHVSYKNLQFFP